MGARNMDDIAELFKGIKFRTKLFGGVSEIDVWKKLDKIQQEYRSAYEIQQERYEARLQERDEEIASLKEKLSQGPAHE